MSSYPIFLQIKQFRCLLIGGGTVATRKAKGLINAGASPVIIAPEITNELKELIRKHNLDWKARIFQKGDIQGFQLIIAATNSVETNRNIRIEALASNVLINDVSNPEGSNFHVPATLRRSKLEIAIGTSGKIPHLSNKIKEYFDQKINPDIGGTMDEMITCRSSIIERSQGNESFKKELMSKELDPLIEQFLKHFIS
jgi:siroheme synthase-like protein